MLYLNQAGTSWPKPGPVRAAVAEALSAAPETWTNSLEDQHRELCCSFGVEEPSRLLLTPGATSALAVAIADHPWQAGDRILTSGLEHHALQRPALQLADRGVELWHAPSRPGEPVDLEALEAELRRGGVRMVAITAACNVTGELLPLDPVIALARQHGALSLIDAAQIAGWLPLDLGRLGADLLVFAGHKGPQAPSGIGGLCIAPGVRMASPAAACGLAEAGEAGACAALPGYCDVGSVNRPALAGLVAGLRWLAAPERAKRLERARHQARRLAESVRELPGVRLYGAEAAEARMPTVALAVAGQSATALATSLAARGVLASGGLQCAPLAHESMGTAPEGLLRLSFGPSNADDDADAAAQTLHELLIH